MSEQPAAIPIHPVAPRLKAGTKVPHIGPHIDNYRAAHKETVGHESDKWWSKVRAALHLSLSETDIVSSKHTLYSIGIAHLRLFAQETLRPETSFGSLKAA